MEPKKLTLEELIALKVEKEYQTHRQCVSCYSHWFFWAPKVNPAVVYCASCGTEHPIQ